jgi:hypothetical protein
VEPRPPNQHANVNKPSTFKTPERRWKTNAKPSYKIIPGTNVVEDDNFYWYTENNTGDRIGKPKPGYRKLQQLKKHSDYIEQQAELQANKPKSKRPKKSSKGTEHNNECDPNGPQQGQVDSNTVFQNCKKKQPISNQLSTLSWLFAHFTTEKVLGLYDKQSGPKLADNQARFIRPEDFLIKPTQNLSKPIIKSGQTQPVIGNFIHSVFAIHSTGDVRTSPGKDGAEYNWHSGYRLYLAFFPTHSEQHGWAFGPTWHGYFFKSGFDENFSRVNPIIRDGLLHELKYNSSPPWIVHDDYYSQWLGKLREGVNNNLVAYTDANGPFWPPYDRIEDVPNKLELHKFYATDIKSRTHWYANSKRKFSFIPNPVVPVTQVSLGPYETKPNFDKYNFELKVRRAQTVADNASHHESDADSESGLDRGQTDAPYDSSLVEG